MGGLAYILMDRGNAGSEVLASDFTSAQTRPSYNLCSIVKERLLVWWFVRLLWKARGCRLGVEGGM